MATIKKMSEIQRKELTQKFIDELETHPSPENDRKLTIYRYIDTFIRSTRDERLAYLACQRLRVVRKCPAGHYRKVIRKMFCRQRFYCIACAEYRMKWQVNQWEDAIKTALRRNNLFLGPVVELLWDIPDVTERVNLRRFNEYLKQTWPVKLSKQGIDPGTWMLLRVYDPIRAQIRALYLGPPLDFRLLRNNSGSKKPDYYPSCCNIKPLIETTRVVNVKRRKRGNFSPWQPKRVKSTYLLDARDESPAVAANLFFRRIRSALDWVVGDILDVFELDPARAYKLDHVYSGRRLNATHGMIYAQPQTASDSNKVDAGPTLVVESTELDGTVGIDTVDPVQLLGAVIERRVASFSGDATPQLCPHCGTAMEDICEENDLPSEITLQ
ncbi:MAG: hypothetical protein WCD02_12510 [Terriglobales bacterium]